MATRSQSWYFEGLEGFEAPSQEVLRERGFLWLFVAFCGPPQEAFCGPTTRGLFGAPTRGFLCATRGFLRLFATKQKRRPAIKLFEEGGCATKQKWLLGGEVPACHKTRGLFERHKTKRGGGGRHKTFWGGRGPPQNFLGREGAATKQKWLFEDPPQTISGLKGGSRHKKKKRVLWPATKFKWKREGFLPQNRRRERRARHKTKGGEEWPATKRKVAFWGRHIVLWRFVAFCGVLWRSCGFLSFCEWFFECFL